jgi:hypothetical protein
MDSPTHTVNHFTNSDEIQNGTLPPEVTWQFPLVTISAHNTDLFTKAMADFPRIPQTAPQRLLIFVKALAKRGSCSSPFTSNSHKQYAYMSTDGSLINTPAL